MDCTLTIDPTAVQHALDACLAVLRDPDSGANFLRGLSVASVFGAAVLASVSAIRRAVRL